MRIFRGIRKGSTSLRNAYWSTFVCRGVIRGRNNVRRLSFKGKKMSRRSMRAIITTFKIEILESKSLMLFRPMLAKLLEGKKPKKRMN